MSKKWNEALILMFFGDIIFYIVVFITFLCRFDKY
jgi:hypothetical protein